MSVGYFLLSPKGTRKSFTLVGFTQDSGKRKHFTVQDDRVKAINQAFKEGTLPLERAQAQFKEIIAELYKKTGSITQAMRRSGLQKDNEKVFSKFWDEVYEGKELEDKSSARYDYVRALKVLGSTSILTASKAEIAKTVRTGTSSKNKHRRVVDRLNTILKFLGRGIHLDKPSEELRDIKHLSQEDLNTLLRAEEDSNYRDLFATLFATGIRIGEAIALDPKDLFQDKLYIGSQMTFDGKKKRPKRGKVGEAAILPEYREYVERWVRVPNKRTYRLNVNRRLKALTRKLWAGDLSKQISVHGFRHSNAIHLLSLGIPMDMVAKNLRNRTEVCQKHYAGYSHSPSSMTAMLALLRERSQA